jgi:DNA-binding response OmpR family regulator
MLTGKTALIADDDRQLLLAMAMRCRRLGFEVRTASNGLDAVIEALAAPPDLFILDIGMPVGDGMRVCQKLVHYPGFETIPIIFLTGRLDDEVQSFCKTLGARHVLKGHRSWEAIESIIGELFRPDPALRAAAGGRLPGA